MTTHLDAMKIWKRNTGIHKFSIQKNSQPSVEVIDQDLVDPRYLKVEVNVDKQAISDNFKETGEELPGVKVSVGSHLRVS